MDFFDLHCDTAYECVCNFNGRGLDHGAHHLSLNRCVSNFHKWYQVFAIFMPDELRGQAAADHYRKIRDYLYCQERDFSDSFTICRDRESFISAKGCGAIMAVEGGSAAAGSLDIIENIYNDGVRLMTLTWNAANEIGGGVLAGGGLTEFGRQAVTLMNKLGMVVDVSHLSDAGFYEVSEISSAPFVASHSCSRSLCQHPRNLTDEMFGIIRDRGGLVGINFSRGFLKNNKRATSFDIIEHTEHFLSLGGDNTVCIGSDFDGTDMPDNITGIESIPFLCELFLHHNYPEELVRNIFFHNAERFFQETVFV